MDVSFILVQMQQKTVQCSANLYFEGMKRCGPLKTDIVGHFSSTDINPGVGFDLDLNCTWTIQLWLDPDKLIELYLTTMDIPSPAEECGSEYFEVHGTAAAIP